METDMTPNDFLDITPLARRYGFRMDFRIGRELAEWARDETVIGCLLRAAADALMMRGGRPESMHPLVFAIKALRAPGELAEHCRLALRLDQRQSTDPTFTLRLAG